MWWAISLVVVGVGALIVGVGIGAVLGYTESEREAAREAARWPRRWVCADGVVQVDTPMEPVMRVPDCCSLRPGDEAAAPGFTRGAEPPLATNRAPQGGGERKKRSTEAIIRAHEEAGR